MRNCIVSSTDLDNNVSYISNVSPLLWTNNKNEAKVFVSENDVYSNLLDYDTNLVKMGKKLGLEFKIEEIS